ncbi:MAG: branched-chain amino acid ABC transporter permease [Burkholderiales bacterium]|nr:branched-chain amino acid ABC transporter permease [Burkholderiales bacterium]
MDAFLSSLISIGFHGLAYGMILYAISVGLSVTMGLMGFVNLAHGVFAMAGGYVMLAAMSRLGLPWLPALGFACVAVALGSVVLERVLYARLYRAGELEQVLFTIGLIFVAIAIARLAYGPLPQAAPLPDYLKGQVEIAGRSFPMYRAAVILSSAVLVAILWIGLERTRWGAIVRAAVDNGPMAESIGIDTGRLFTLTFAVGSGLAALGGALGADLIAMTPTYPFEQLVYFLVVVAVGGLGTLRGPFLGALLIGLGDTACKYWVPQFGAFFVFAATFALLLWRPRGLLGRA